MALMKLTGRDKEMLAAIGRARMLSTEQLRRLFWQENKDPSNTTRRLGALAGLTAGVGGLNGALVSRQEFRTYDRQDVTFWSLTSHGARMAEDVLGAKLPGWDQSVGERFLEHHMLCAELFVAMSLACLGSGSRMATLPFRWEPAQQVLPWEEHDTYAGRQQTRRIYPDAVLELPEQRLRIFVEMETGSQAIVSSVPNEGASVNKAARYSTFLSGTSGGSTFYKRTYPDDWAAEVLFLTHREVRRDSLQAGLETWRTARNSRLAFRVATIGDAANHYLSLCGRTATKPAEPKAVAVSPGSASAGLASPPFSKADAKLLLEFYNATRMTLMKQRELLSAAKLPKPELPGDLVKKTVALIERLQLLARSA
jgi:hypothetical protein